MKTYISRAVSHIQPSSDSLHSTLKLDDPFLQALLALDPWLLHRLSFYILTYTFHSSLCTFSTLYAILVHNATLLPPPALCAAMCTFPHPLSGNLVRNDAGCL